ncbi:glycoside hydrolase family 43 protein [Bifidobacterium favimelis]
MKISNPVLRGFNPDPCLIRVDGDYYMACSTFEWWPGVSLYRSEDLAHWIPLPPPLDRTSQLDLKGVPSSGGVWAPDLSYADGLFWLVYANVRVVNGTFKDCTNYLVTSKRIEGPWSDPIRLNGVGFDASLFHDDDGCKYLVQQTWDFREYRPSFDGITLTRYDPDSRRLLPETARTIWAGTSAGVIEGPRLYKRAGLYYLFAAEGGTGYEHQESVARSTSLDAGSFQVMPGNPLLSDRDDPDSYLQKQGHGSLVETPKGQWYYASLCARPFRHGDEPASGPRGWCPLGRETAIQEVRWDADGWPRVVGGRSGLRYVQGPDDAPTVAGGEEGHSHDDFISDHLGRQWMTPRVPFGPAMGSLGHGCLRLKGQGSLCNTFDLSLVARRWQAPSFEAQVQVAFDPRTYMQMAGLTNYYNDRFWSWAYLTWDEARSCRVIEVAQHDWDRHTSLLRDRAVAVPDGVGSVWLRTVVRRDKYWYEYSFDGGRTHRLPVTLDAAVLSDDHAAQHEGGFFTGAFVGMAAVDLSGYGAPADFMHFDYREAGE